MVTMIDLFTIDITSSLMVVIGFTCCHVFIASDATHETYRHVFIFYIADAWLATILSCFFGSLYAISVGKFHAQDIILTLVEGLTTLRQIELSQAPGAAHSLNPFAWPVLCMFIPVYLLPRTYNATAKMHTSLKDFGIYIIIVLCSSGIVLISIFASLHDNSNIFYSNASCVAYRMLEFNLGVNLFYLVSLKESGTMLVLYVCNRLKMLIVTIFACVWWSEFGVSIEKATVPCVRLYHFNSCLTDHPGILIRGCFLGTSIIAWNYHERQLSTWLGSPCQALMTSISSVLLCSPLYFIFKGALQFSFGTTMVNENSSLLSLLMPVFVFCIVYAYNLRVKPVIHNDIDIIARDVHARFIVPVKQRFANQDSAPSPTESHTPEAGSRTFSQSTDS